MDAAANISSAKLSQNNDSFSESRRLRTSAITRISTSALATITNDCPGNEVEGMLLFLPFPQSLHQQRHSYLHHVIHIVPSVDRGLSLGARAHRYRDFHHSEMPVARQQN